LEDTPLGQAIGFTAKFYGIGESEETRHARLLIFAPGFSTWIQKSFPSGMMFYLVSRSIEMDYQEAGVMEDPCMIQF